MCSEISKLVSAGAKRKRLNFDYLSDNVVSEINGVGDYCDYLHPILNKIILLIGKSFS